MTILRFLIVTLTLLYSITLNDVQAQGFLDCNLGCPGNPDILGFSTLRDLRCAMLVEKQRVADANPSTNPPFRYQLCPETTYVIASEEDVILPQLQRTIVQCGGAGLSTDNCIIQGSFNGHQVLIDQTILEVTLPGQENAVDFAGLTFEHPQGGGVTVPGLASIMAGPPSTIRAKFTDCHWRDLINMAAISNVGDDTNAAMPITIIDSTFTDTEHTIMLPTEPIFGILTTRGSVSLTNVNFTNYNASALIDTVTSQVTWRGGVISGNILKDPRNFNDIILADDSIVTLSELEVYGNDFSNFVWVQNTATMTLSDVDVFSNAACNSLIRQTTSGHAVTISDSFMEAEASDGMIFVSGFGDTADLTVVRSVLDSRFSKHAIASLAMTSLTEVCFHGQTTFAPVYVSGGETFLAVEDVFIDAISLESECDELFVENNGADCFDNPSIPCDGQCFESDANECFDPQLPPIPRCDNVCEIIPNVEQCMETLRDLRCAMCLEAQAVAAGSPFRNAPYTYELCAGTTFTIQDEELETIYPILDNTRFRCGPDGSSVNNCIIEGGLLQVEISRQSRSSTFLASPRPLTIVSFEGIRFRETKVDPRFRRSASVWARGEEQLRATFSDCHWSNVGGTHLILNVNPSAFGNIDDSAEPAMAVLVRESSISDSNEGFDHRGIQSNRGRIEFVNVDFTRYITPIRMLGAFQEATIDMDNVNIVDCGAPANAFREAEMIQVEESSTFSSLETTFTGGVQTHAGGIITARSGSRVQIDRTVFQNDLNATVGVGGNSSVITVENSCFVNSKLDFLVYGSGDSNVVSNNNFQGFFLETNCRGAFLETEGSGCIDPDVGGCQGQCVVFDSSECAALLMPTPAPTPFPTTRSPSATDFPTRSPSESPSYVPSLEPSASIAPSNSGARGERKIMSFWSTGSFMTLWCALVLSFMF